MLELIPLLLLAVAFGQSPIQPTSLQQGLLELRDGHFFQAKTSFESAIEQDPKNAFAWVSLAEANRRIGENSAATEAAKKAEQFGVTIPAVDHALASFYTEQHDFAHAAQLEERFAASSQADQTASLRTAELYQHAGDPLNAERILKSAWQKHVNDPSIAFDYAQLLLQKLDFVAAEKVVAPAINAHPKNPQLILVSGVARYGERQFADAMDHFLKVIVIDPTISQPYVFLGKMLEQAGVRLPAITKAFELRLKSAPDDAVINLVLAKARLQSNAQDPTSEALLRHSLEIDPTQWEAHYELGVVLETRRNYRSAIDEFNRSVELDAKQPMPHYHLARAYDRLGDPGRASQERKLHEALSNIPK